MSDMGKRTAKQEASALSDPESFDEVDGAQETSLDPRIDKLIGRSLTAHYSDIVSAPLPDTILVLLAQLEAKEKGA
jgi:hypothetical protein